MSNTKTKSKSKILRALLKETNPKEVFKNISDPASPASAYRASRASRAFLNTSAPVANAPARASRAARVSRASRAFLNSNSSAPVPFVSDPPANFRRSFGNASRAYRASRALRDSNAPTAPTANAPTANAPTINAPTANAPTINAPTANAPTANAPKIKSYVYCGHGGEIFDEIPDTITYKPISVPRIKTVLNGCTLSTLTRSGDATSLLSILHFHEYIKMNRHLFSDPLSNFKEIEHLVLTPLFQKNNKHIPVGTFHSHGKDYQYLDKSCDFLFMFNGIDLVPTANKSSPIIHQRRIFKSGLIPLESIPSDKPFVDVDIRNMISIETITDIYSDSVYPELSKIKQNIKHLLDNNPHLINNSPNNSYANVVETRPISFDIFVRAVRLSCTKTLSELMYLFPGNHYFIVCRVAVGIVDGKYVERRVKKSNVITYRKASNNNVSVSIKKPLITPMFMFSNGPESFRLLILEFMNDHFSNARHVFGEKTLAPFKNYEEADAFLFKVLTDQSIVDIKFINSINELIIKIKHGIEHGVFTSENVCISSAILEFIHQYNDFFKSSMGRALEPYP